jgi:rare lipoprotein A
MKTALIGSTMALCAVFMVGVGTHPISAIEKPVERKCVVSWYGEKYRGRLMANGKPFNPAAMTVAHKSLPFGTRVQFQLGPRSIIATVTDRGPFVAGREFDLSSGAFAQLAQIEAGLIRPRWRIVK